MWNCQTMRNSSPISCMNRGSSAKYLWKYESVRWWNWPGKSFMVHIDLQNQDLKKQYHVLSAPFILGGKVNKTNKVETINLTCINNGCISKGQISEHVVRKGPLASCPHHPCCPGHFLEGCKCEIWRQAAHALHEMVITKDHNCSLVLGRAGHLTVKHALSRASTFVQQLNFGGRHLKLTNPAVKLQEAFSVSFWLTFQWNLRQTPNFDKFYRSCMLPFCIKDPKPAMWKVGGIKIERTRARNFFFEDGQGN